MLLYKTVSLYRIDSIRNVLVFFFFFDFAHRDLDVSLDIPSASFGIKYAILELA